jgi:FimV-like protein
MYLGGAALARNDFARAEGLYQSVVQKQPNNVVALNNLAWVMGRLGREGALEYAEEAAKLAPNQPDVLDTLASLLAERNDYEKAVELQRRAMELQPANASLKLNLAKIYIKSGDKILAKRELEALSKGGDQSAVQVQARELLKTI